ncbi:MAG: YraN family protein, partial [Pseudomonadales bacterium]
IEVRQRGSRAFGGAAQSVTASKQQKLIRCAQHYLQCHDCSGYQSFRFDVLAFETSPAQLPPIWYKDAFRL